MSLIVRILLASVVVLVVSCLRPVLAFAEDAHDIVSYQSQAGVFARPLLSAEQMQVYQEQVREIESTFVESSSGSLLSDDDGFTNELILRIDVNAAAFRMFSPHNSLTQAEAEGWLLERIRERQPEVLSVLGYPTGARYVIRFQRLNAEERLRHESDSDLEELHRYVILSYVDIQRAKAALSKLQVDFEDEIVMNITSESSWVPNDPYFPVKTSAMSSAEYQWGLHAMNFPAAWETSRGHGYVAVVDGGIAYDSTCATTSDLVPNADLHGNFRHQFYTRTKCVSQTASRHHGSHVAGIIAATANNGQGVSGACPNCALIVTETALNAADEAASITSSVRAGAQVINMSWGNSQTGSAAVPPCPATSSAYKVVCTALSFATSRDVLLVAAAGNMMQTTPQFPAREPSVLAVAGAELVGAGNPSVWTRWYLGVVSGNTIGSNYAGLGGVVGPGADIVSTFPESGVTYNADYRCGDSATADDSGIPNDTFGSCSGTSMAAPFLSGLGGLVRSVNPRMSAATVTSHIQAAGNVPGSAYNPILGRGMANAGTAVSHVLGATPNALTPLFSFYSPDRLDYFYTTVPQMAATATCGNLRPFVGGVATQNNYYSVGSPVSGYGSFPGSVGAGCVNNSALAEAWVFSIPKIGAVNLAPLYRLSWKCGDATPAPPAACLTHPLHTDVTYTTDMAGVQAFEAVGYKLDGVEGYIYPKSVSQPPGTVRLMRRYNPVRDDHAIFPEPKTASMIAEGYTDTSGSDWLGYVYLNTGPVPSL